MQAPFPSTIFFAVMLAALSACSGDLHPTDSLEVAVKGIHGGALTDDGNAAVIGSIHHGGSYWKIGSQERAFNWNHKEGETTTIVVADFSSDNAWALTANPYNLVLWNTASGQGERFWAAPGEILDAELGPGANIALLGLSDHTAVIFNIRRGGIMRTFQHQNRVRSVDFSKDGRLALTGSEDYTATLWDVSSGNMLKNMKHEDDVQLVKLSPNGDLALSVSKYDKAVLWDTSTGKARGELKLNDERIKRGATFVCARFNEDGTLLLTGQPDQIVQLWDVATLSPVASWKLPKRDPWKPTSASVIDVSFTEEPSTYRAIASNGFIHTLKQ